MKPGRRFAVSDVVSLCEKRGLPDRVVRSVELWSGCVSVALEKGEYEALLSGAGFEEVTVEVTHVYPAEQIPALTDGEAEAPRARPGRERLQPGAQMRSKVAVAQKRLDLVEENGNRLAEPGTEKVGRISVLGRRSRTRSGSGCSG